MTLMSDKPTPRARSLAAAIASHKLSIERDIKAADEQHLPVPTIVRVTPANLSAWMKMIDP